MSGEIVTEYRGKVAVITVSDPQRRNALTVELSAELANAVSTAEHDSGVHAIVVTGAPPAFCAGADLSALGESHDEGLRAIYAGFLALARCELPTVAAVGGPAVGAGLNLALAADVRIAGPKARFDARFLRLGLHPGGGMTWMLQRAVGVQQAAAMTLFGEILNTSAAQAAGLVLRTVEGDHDQLIDAACEFADAAEDAPRALLTTTKRTLRDTSVMDTHDEAVQAEIAPQLDSIASPEFAERLAAMKRSTTN